MIRATAEADADIDQDEGQPDKEAVGNGQRQKITIPLGKRSLVCHVSLCSSTVLWEFFSLAVYCAL